MALAQPLQKTQDWITQQWVICTGRKIDLEKHDWLIGAIGNNEKIGEDFIRQLAQQENLILLKNSQEGLISQISNLLKNENELAGLHPAVKDFYEHTSNYDLQCRISWNPYFKFFGFLLNKLFSNRIHQLNIPTHSNNSDLNLSSEIITLLNDKNEVKYTFWLRKDRITNTVIYSGIYSICKLNNDIACVKAVFPLPKGNATVILKPSITENGGLVLNSSGEKFGDAGFYFTLQDNQQQYRSNYIKSFRDRLFVSYENNCISALQTLTLWNLKVLELKYTITKKAQLK